MNAEKQSVIQLTKSDLLEIAQAANMKADLPIRIEKDGDALKIYIEDRKLKDMLWCFISQIVPIVTVNRSDAADISFNI